MSLSSSTLLSSSQSSPSSSQSSSTPEESGDEAIIKVPHEFMEFPLGFVVDSGGSIAKVLYRSLKDYKNGKLLKPSDHGLLHLKYFNKHEVDQMASFLKNHCDIMDTKETFDVTWFVTGITTQHFKANIQEQLGAIKTKLLLETTAFQNAIHSADFLKIGHYELNHEVLIEISNRFRIFMELLKHAVKLDENFEKLMDRKEVNAADETKNGNLNGELSEMSGKLTETTISEQAVPGNSTSKTSVPFSQLIFEPNVDWKEWSDKNLESNQDEIVKPSLFVMYGSGCVLFLVDGKKNLKLLDIVEPAGKAFCGIVEEMIGVDDFDTLMKMAEKGDLKKVNTHFSELKNHDHKEEDVYSYCPQDYVVFQLGKLSSSYATEKGKYTKEDVAVGMLNYQASIISKLLIMSARVHKVDTVYMCGSFVKYKLNRKFIERYFLEDSLKDFMEGSPLMKIHFIRNPGFFVGLGTWSANVDMAKKLREPKADNE